MNRFRIVVITSLIIFSSIVSFSSINDTALYINLQKSKNANERIQGLNLLAYYYTQIVDNNILADSLCKESVILAHLREDNNLICYTALVYSDLSLPSKFESADAYLNEAISIAELKKDNTLLSLLYLQKTKLYVAGGKNEKAREYIQRALNYIGNNKLLKAYYYLTLGDLQLQLNEKINSFENYNNAIYTSKDIEHDSLLIESYLRMYNFYLFNNNATKAKENLSLANHTILTSQKRFLYDSLLLKSNLIEIYFRENKNELALKLADEVMEACDGFGYLLIKDRVFATIRKYYLGTNNPQEICDLYCKKYPQELIRLQRTDSAIYYRVLSLINENKQKKDSAFYYMKLAEAKTLESNNTASIANFYKREGQFYLRQQQENKALQSFQLYYNFALSSGHFPFIIESASILDSIYIAKGNISQAYHFTKIKQLYIDSNTTLLENDKLLEIELDNYSKLNELQIEKEELQTTRRSNVQVTIILFVILLSLITLVLLSNYKIPSSIVKGFGYITFVMVFEFIILMLDNKIHHWAHGQPLKILVVKIVIIAFLLPLHHATEHKVVHFLLKNRLINQGSTSAKSIYSSLKSWIQNSIHKADENIDEHDAISNDNESLV
jgi:hypothetical protein